MAPSFLENLNLWCASFRRFVIQKENKMKPWKRHVLITHTVCKNCWLICYATDMGPEIPTAAADQKFVWICKQHQDVLSFRTKIIWSGPEFGLVLCGYLHAANIVLAHGQVPLWSGPNGTERYRLHYQIWSGPWSNKDLVWTKLVL